MANVMYRWFLFGMNPDILAFKDCILTNYYKFWMDAILVVKILTQILLTLLTFIAYKLIHSTFFLFGMSYHDVNFQFTT